ncbi:hypothetical protein [Kitasatospora indigofera]|uniref:hypothetical protein n=1 Tax=Kitasatospora indigofera TaxID=67307 RepID=UPI0033B40D62
MPGKQMAVVMLGAALAGTYVLGNIAKGQARAAAQAAYRAWGYRYAGTAIPWDGQHPTNAVNP